MNRRYQVTNQGHKPAGSRDASGKKNGGQFRPAEARPKAPVYLSRLGPNATEVEDFIERVRTLTNNEATLLGELSLDHEQMVDRSSAYLKWHQAWRDAVGVIDTEQFMTAKRALDWVINYDAPHRSVVLDALVATLVRGVVNDDSFHVLYDPWAKAVNEQEVSSD